jgi:hypothetical protein
MGNKLPQPSAILVDRMQRAARYLDQIAENCADEGARAIARAHANTVWQGAGRLEDLARLVDELIPGDPPATRELGGPR